MSHIKNINSLDTTKKWASLSFDTMFFFSIFFTWKIPFLLIFFISGLVCIFYLISSIKRSLDKCFLDKYWLALIILMPTTSLLIFYSGKLSINKGYDELLTIKRFKIEISIALFVLIVLSITKTFDYVLDSTLLASISSGADNYLDDVFTRAGLSFVYARAINGIVSVLQSIVVEVSFASINVFEVLDPMNDLVERFSWVMLAATGSVLIQKTLIEIGSWLGVFVIGTTGFAVTLIGMWFRDNNLSRKFIKAGVKIIVVGLIVKIAIPSAAFFCSNLSEVFIIKQYDQAFLNLQDQTRLIQGASKSITGGEEVAINISDKRKILSRTLKGFERKNENVLFIASSAYAEESFLDNAIDQSSKYIGGVVEKGKETTSSAIIKTTEALKSAKEKISNTSDSVVDSASSSFDSVVNFPENKINEIKTKISAYLEEFVSSIIVLISLFFLEVLLLPILTLYFIIKVAQWIIEDESKIQHYQGKVN